MSRDYSNYYIITDLDGTLLPHSKIISDEDILAVKDFVDNGGHFSIATGRPIQSVIQYLDKIMINMPIILYNGSMIYDINKKAPIWCDYLPNDTKELIKNVLNWFPDVSAEILTYDKVYAVQVNDAERHHIEVSKTSPVFCTVDEAEGGWLKALFAADPQKLPDVIRYVDSLSHDNISYVQSCRFFYEMIPKNTSKGTALKKLVEICGLDSIKLLAVGDYYNDAEMILSADIGFAVSNAQPEIKEVADVILDVSCEGSPISRIIEYINCHMDI